MMRGERRGFLLITTLMIALVVVILVLGTAATSLIDRQVSAGQRDGTRAYYVAQAGLERLMTGVFLNYVGLEGTQGQLCVTPIDTGLDLGTIELRPGQWTDPIPFLDDWYRIQYSLSGDLIVLRSEGRVGGTQTSPRGRSTLQAIATLTREGPDGWTDALRAEQLERATGGQGQVGRVAVFGSVHIVKSDVDVSDEIDEVVGIGGNAGIFNNYAGDGKTGPGGNNVTANARAMLGDFRAGIQDLCSRVKIDQGNLVVNAGTAANLGAPALEPVESQRDNPNALQGLYFGTTASGARGTLVEKQGSSYVALSPTPENNVYVKNPIGYYETFETKVPGLDPDFPNEPIAGTSHSLSAADMATCGLIREVEVGTGQDRTTVRKLLIPPPGAVGTIACSGITYDAAAHRLTLDGTINIADMDVVIDPPSSVGKIKIAGSGALRVGTLAAPKSITVIGGVEPDVPDLYLKDPGSVLGLVATGPIKVDTTSSNPNLAALLYSHERIEFSGQTVVAGALMSKHVVTAQVPRILYHPDVAAAAGRIGMPGTSDDGPQGEFSRFSVERR